jgi:hypothetical protein
LYAEQLQSWVTAGRLTLRLKSYVSTIGDDLGRLMLRFYDEDMSLISTHQDTRFETAADMNDNVWSEAVFFQRVPINARFVGVVLHGDNNGGSNTMATSNHAGGAVDRTDRQFRPSRDRMARTTTTTPMM